MKNLFDPVVVEGVLERLSRLHVGSERQWGRMDVAQMLAHCVAAMEMATGVVRVKRAPLPAAVIGRLIKPLVLRGDAPMRRNSPSSPELFRVDATGCDFARERERLIASIARFADLGAACCTEHPHPFFGQLQPEEWAVLAYKHVDHHLRQFGV